LYGATTMKSSGRKTPTTPSRFVHDPPSIERIIDATRAASSGDADSWPT
jgi:hypothetical protein